MKSSTYEVNKTEGGYYKRKTSRLIKEVLQRHTLPLKTVITTVDDNSITQRKQENRSNLKTVFLYTLQGTNLRELLSLN